MEAYKKLLNWNMWIWLMLVIFQPPGRVISQKELYEKFWDQSIWAYKNNIGEIQQQNDVYHPTWVEVALGAQCLNARPSPIWAGKLAAWKTLSKLLTVYKKIKAISDGIYLVVVIWHFRGGGQYKASYTSIHSDQAELNDNCNCKWTKDINSSFCASISIRLKASALYPPQLSAQGQIHQTMEMQEIWE